MPTNRKRTTRGRRGPPIDHDQWAVLTDQEPENPFIKLIPREKQWRDLWTEHRDAILADWAAKHPGTRPSFWWKYDAPRELAPNEDDPTGEPWDVPFARLQIGGAPVEPDASHCAGNFGIPASDLDDDDPALLANPPIWESQAAYLKRHRLLYPGEATRIKSQAAPAARAGRPAAKRS